MPSKLNVYTRLLATVLLITGICLLTGGRVCAENWSLLIGIDQYEDLGRINNLSGATADARALKGALTESAGFPEANIRLLVSDGNLKPTRSNIFDELARLAQNAGPDDTVFVFFAGHGVEVAGESYLLPFDTRAIDQLTMVNTAVPVALIRQQLAQIKAKALILAFDMCRGNPFKDGKSLGNDDHVMSRSLSRSLNFTKGDVAVVETSASTPIAATLYSCSANERSWESAQKGRGYFSYFLEQGLRGKAADARGQVTIISLANYVTREVQKVVKQEQDKSQTPHQSLEGVGADSFVIKTGVSPIIAPPTESTGPEVVSRSAKLLVTSNAPATTVTIAGKEIKDGVWTEELMEPEKDIEVKITAPGYDGQLVAVTLVRGKTIHVPVTLERMSSPPPMTKSTTGASLTPTDPPLTVAEYKAQMIPIPEGEFYMGSDNGGREDMRPAHKVFLSAYRIGKTPVTVGMYEEFCRETGRRMPTAPPFNEDWVNKDHPIVNITWSEAKEYCKWAGLKLPTEAQWEKAARGTTGRIYPWGNDWNAQNLRSSTGRRIDGLGTRRVGSFPSGASLYGCLDMAGNVWQWCEDCYDASYYSTRRASAPNPVNAIGGDNRVLRGGSWYESNATLFRSTYRNKILPTTRSSSYGFRAVAVDY